MKIAELLMRETLPRKDFFRASEVSSLLKVRPYEIYYWESQFPKLRSQKSKAGKRLYRREEVVLISAIRHLLKEKSHTIESAQKVIADMDHVFAPINCEADDPPVELLEKCTYVENGMENSLWAHVNDIDHDQILGDVSEILGEEDDFDELTHKIYQHCSAELEAVEAQPEPEPIGILIEEPLNEKPKVFSPIEKKALLSLKESQKHLHEILNSLDRYKDQGFWQGFNV